MSEQKCVICGAEKSIMNLVGNPEFGFHCINQEEHETARKSLLKNAMQKVSGNQVEYEVLIRAAMLATWDGKQDDIVRLVEACQKTDTVDSYKVAVMIVSFPYQYGRGSLETLIKNINICPYGRCEQMGFAVRWIPS